MHGGEPRPTHTIFDVHPRESISGRRSSRSGVKSWCWLDKKRDEDLSPPRLRSLLKSLRLPLPAGLSASTLKLRQPSLDSTCHFFHVTSSTCRLSGSYVHYSRFKVRGGFWIFAYPPHGDGEAGFIRLKHYMTVEQGEQMLDLRGSGLRLKTEEERCVCLHSMLSGY